MFPPIIAILSNFDASQDRRIAANIGRCIARRVFGGGTMTASSMVMQRAIQVTFRNLPHSQAIDSYVRARAAKLETRSSRISRCHVVVEAPNHHRPSGRHFRVGIDLTIPGAELVVSHAPGDYDGTDLYATIDRAFDRIGRCLEEKIRQRRGD